MYEKDELEKDGEGDLNKYTQVGNYDKGKGEDLRLLESRYLLVELQPLFFENPPVFPQLIQLPIYHGVLFLIFSLLPE